MKKYPECSLLGELTGRRKRHEAKIGPPDKRRPPSQEEGMRIARPMLSDTAKRSAFSFDQEAEAVWTMLAARYLPPFIEYNEESFIVLRQSIEYAKTSRVYFRALDLCYAEFRNRGWQPPRDLFRWHQQVAAGRHKCPKGNKLRRGRPHIVVNPLRDIQVQFVIEILFRLGMPLRARDRSAFRAVADIIGKTEWDVEFIWKKRVGTKHFPVTLQKQSRAIAKRTGPFLASPATPR